MYFPMVHFIRSPPPVPPVPPIPLTISHERVLKTWIIAHNWQLHTQEYKTTKNQRVRLQLNEKVEGKPDKINELILKTKRNDIEGGGGCLKLDVQGQGGGVILDVDGRGWRSLKIWQFSWASYVYYPLCCFLFLKQECVHVNPLLQKFK